MKKKKKKTIKYRLIIYQIIIITSCRDNKVKYHFYPPGFPSLDFSRFLFSTANTECRVLLTKNNITFLPFVMNLLKLVFTVFRNGWDKSVTRHWNVQSQVPFSNALRTSGRYGNSERSCFTHEWPDFLVKFSMRTKFKLVFSG